MLRADAMRHANGQVGIRARRHRHGARPHRSGRAGWRRRRRPSANKVVGGQARFGGAQGDGGRSPGVSSVRLLPPYARQRFTTWFKRRPRVRIAKRQGRVAVFPTCLVEYQKPSIGHDLVKVYERNGIECSLAEDAGCCGAPWLHSGDVEQFTKVAEQERQGARQVDRAAATTSSCPSRRAATC